MHPMLATEITLKACGKASQWQRALGLFSELQAPRRRGGFALPELDLCVMVFGTVVAISVSHYQLDGSHFLV